MRQRSLPNVTRWLALFAAIGSLGIASCGRGIAEIEVSGTATYQGQPIPSGVIYFEPTVAAGKTAPTGFAIIREGRFRTESGRCPGPGSYVARVTGGDGRSTGLVASLDPESPPEQAMQLGTAWFRDREIPVDLPNKDIVIELEVPSADEASR